MDIYGSDIKAVTKGKANKFKTQEGFSKTIGQQFGCKYPINSETPES